MEQPALRDAVISAVPFILLIGFWIYFLYAFRKSGAVKQQRDHLERSRLHMERTEQLLERIAAAVERRHSE